MYYIKDKQFTCDLWTVIFFDKFTHVFKFFNIPSINGFILFCCVWSSVVVTFNVFMPLFREAEMTFT